MFEVKGHIGQGQRSHGPRSNVTWVKPSLKVMIFAHVTYDVSCTELIIVGSLSF